MSKYINLQSQENVIKDLQHRVKESIASYPMLSTPQEKMGVAIDIGANIGGFVVHAHKCFEKVYAFEPVIENYNILSQIIKFYEIKNTEAFHTAVYGTSNKELPLKIHENKFSGCVSCANFDNKDWNFSEVGEICQTISLADMMTVLNLNRIDYLKVDCEGSEYEIFENFYDYDKIDVIALEIHGFFGEKRKEALLSLLIDHYFCIDLSTSERKKASLMELILASESNAKLLLDKSNFLLINRNMIHTHNLVPPESL